MTLLMLMLPLRKNKKPSPSERHLLSSKDILFNIQTVWHLDLSRWILCVHQLYLPSSPAMEPTVASSIDNALLTVLFGWFGCIFKQIFSCSLHPQCCLCEQSIQCTYDSIIIGSHFKLFVLIYLLSIKSN